MRKSVKIHIFPMGKMILSIAIKEIALHHQDYAVAGVILAECYVNETFG
jgi:hypothetical protein